MGCNDPSLIYHYQQSKDIEYLDQIIEYQLQQPQILNLLLFC
jgi:hypothetical protein